MPRYKQPKDPRGGHVRIYWDILDSHAWQALSWADQGLYVALRRKLLGTNNGNIEATLATLRHSGIRSSASLAKGLRALRTVGLIDQTRQGGVAAGGKLCSLYRFTDEATLEHPKQGVKAMPATNEWKRFNTRSEAKRALRDAHHAAHRPDTKSSAKVQSLSRLGSATEPSAGKLSSDPEQGDSRPAQELNAIHASRIELEPA